VKRSDCLALMTLLTAAYPRQELSQETTEVYVQYLQDLELKAARAAIDRLVATSEWFPTVAEIRRVVAELVCQLPSPESAWVEVMRELNRCHEYERPEWSCDLVREAVGAVGWRRMQMSENLSVERGQFLRIYGDLRRGELEECNVRSLGQPRSAGELTDGRRSA